MRDGTGGKRQFQHHVVSRVGDFSLQPLAFTLSPLRSWPATQTFDSPGGLRIAQQEPDHVAADAGAGAFQVGNPELTAGGFDGQLHQFGFRATFGFHLACALREFAVGAADDGEEAIKPR